jgi:hypothetical protein
VFEPPAPPPPPIAVKPANVDDCPFEPFLEDKLTISAAAPPAPTIGV